MLKSRILLLLCLLPTQLVSATAIVMPQTFDEEGQGFKIDPQLSQSLLVDLVGRLSLQNEGG